MSALLDRVDLGRHTRSSMSPGTSRAVAAVLLVALLAAGVWAVALAGELTSSSGDAGTSLSAQEQDRRDAQLAVASFAANFNNYSVDDIDGYKQRMMPLMTSGFGQSFEYAVDGIVTQVKATKMTSRGEVVQTAVSAIDADHATALVVADVDVTSALGNRERHFRWKVSLVRSGDTWLVDDFEPVA